MGARLEKTARRAKAACRPLSALETDRKNKALTAMARAVRSDAARILAANAKDLKAFKGADTARGRLALDPVKLSAIAASIENIAGLPDPVGRLISETVRPNGLRIRKVGVPIGAILIIYESRPNVTADCMALCLKSGNSVILKGGSEAVHSNRALYAALARAAAAEGVPAGAFGFIDAVGAGARRAVPLLLKMDQWIDLVIPRGGEGLIREVARLSRIPVIKHFKGVCHVYVDKDADLRKAAAIVLNAKVQNPAVCNAAEALLVHRDIADRFLPRIEKELTAKGVIIRRDKKAWGQEFLDLILAVRVVKDVNEAIDHIETYGSRHSDAIVTENAQTAKTFKDAVDSSCVFVNCSTRFNDGGEFGMGAEMGISTDKLHVRGPMGLEELTSYKYVVEGDGQIRQ
ncbi:MAG: glutamate-5-semialdehyde dehydrogenase [Omnitrophica bacterium RIFCSPHIGHO2_02_FULL_63_14]|nr:MAG: glutamate-5-semialdehyde dehydrogenase [Omnitrophica bacterium RIFCSPHIGHO2_02_FULL_63_14]